jgi:hypothetical protein
LIDGVVPSQDYLQQESLYLSDQIGFILHHHVMQKQTDDKVAITMVEESRKRLQRLRNCSFDKGCNEPSNQKDLKELTSLCLSS